jgi:hypothetical protein
MKRAPTSDEIELLLSFAGDYIKFAEEMIGPVYGPYMGGNPRNFTPDPDDATEQEIERHRRACEAWERGERKFATGFGLGSTYDRANDERCKRLRRFLEGLL